MYMFFNCFRLNVVVHHLAIMAPWIALITCFSMAISFLEDKITHFNQEISASPLSGALNSCNNPQIKNS
jgi:hypothetical protein